MKIVPTLGNIYKITNKLNNKIYVGQTIIDINQRLHNHFSYAFNKNATTYLANAIRKYGRSAFVIEYLEVCSIGNLNKAERKWIKRLHSNINTIGYNMSAGGDGGRNSLSFEVREKISNTKSGVSTGPFTKERCDNISKAKLASGYKHSEETLQKIRRGRQAYTLTSEHKRNISIGINKAKVFYLSEAQHDEIKSKTLRKSDAELAKEYKVSRKTIWRVRRGLYYKNGK